MSTLYPLEGFLIQAEGSRPTPQTIARALQAAHALTPFSECRVAKRWVPADFSVEGITEALASTRFGPILWELAGNATSYVSYAWDWLQVPYAYATLKLHLSGPTPELMTADAVLNWFGVLAGAFGARRGGLYSAEQDKVMQARRWEADETILPPPGAERPTPSLPALEPSDLAALTALPIRFDRARAFETVWWANFAADPLPEAPFWQQRQVDGGWLWVATPLPPRREPDAPWPHLAALARAIDLHGAQQNAAENVVE